MKSYYTITILLLVCILCRFTALSQTVGGIGAQLKLDSSDGHTMPVIQKLVPGSPAAATLKENQFIIKVDNNECKDKTLEQIVGWIRGAVGSPVKMTMADNRTGKQAKEYTLTRAAIAAPPDNPGADPVTGFFAACEAEVKQMKKKGIAIVKTFNSECGDFFFNFDADQALYNVDGWILQPQANSGDYPTIRIFDNDDEKNTAFLGHPEFVSGIRAFGLTGSLMLKKETVATISVKLNGAATNCRAMYLVVYKQ